MFSACSIEQSTLQMINKCDDGSKWIEMIVRKKSQALIDSSFVCDQIISENTSPFGQVIPNTAFK